MAKLDYYNVTHTGLSYSRQLVLQNCPRKYELDSKYAIKANRSSVTFSYGHAVALGIQYAIAGYSYNRCMIEAMLGYTHGEDDLGTDAERASKKSLWSALLAVSEFHQKYELGLYKFLDGWQIAKVLNSKGELVEAIELTFVMELLEDFTYEGHIDLVLYHPVKKRFMVVELKTTGLTTVDEASYKNSSQALGYGAVIDLMADSLGHSASFDVLYLVFQSRSRTLVPMPFTKTPRDRAEWITSLVVDVQQIQQYEQMGYPKRGQNCYNFFRACEYIKTCGLTNESLSKMYTKPTGETDAESYTQLLEPDFKFTLEDLLVRQEELIALIEKGKESASGDADLFFTSMDV